MTQSTSGLLESNHSCEYQKITTAEIEGTKLSRGCLSTPAWSRQTHCLILRLSTISLEAATTQSTNTSIRWRTTPTTRARTWASTNQSQLPWSLARTPCLPTKWPSRQVLNPLARMIHWLYQRHGWRRLKTTCSLLCRTAHCSSSLMSWQLVISRWTTTWSTLSKHSKRLTPSKVLSSFLTSRMKLPEGKFRRKVSSLIKKIWTCRLETSLLLLERIHSWIWTRIGSLTLLSSSIRAFLTWSKGLTWETQSTREESSISQLSRLSIHKQPADASLTSLRSTTTPETQSTTGQTLSSAMARTPPLPAQTLSSLITNIELIRV